MDPAQVKTILVTLGQEYLSSRRAYVYSYHGRANGNAAAHGIDVFYHLLQHPSRVVHVRVDPESNAQSLTIQARVLDYDTMLLLRRQRTAPGSEAAALLQEFPPRTIPLYAGADKSSDERLLAACASLDAALAQDCELLRRI